MNAIDLTPSIERGRGSNLGGLVRPDLNQNKQGTVVYAIRRVTEMARVRVSKYRNDVGPTNGGTTRGSNLRGLIIKNEILFFSVPFIVAQKARARVRK